VAARLIAACVADPAMPRAAIAAEIEDFAAAEPAVVRSPAIAPAPLDGRPLRVGFLSARFRAGAGLDLFLPLIEARDRGEWHALLYIAGRCEDGAARRLRNAAAAVSEIGEVDDDTAAFMLGNDALDVLVDLDLHEPGWRPGLAMQRPAAVMVGWLGL